MLVLVDLALIHFDLICLTLIERSVLIRAFACATEAASP